MKAAYDTSAPALVSTVPMSAPSTQPHRGEIEDRFEEAGGDQDAAPRSRGEQTPLNHRPGVSRPQRPHAAAADIGIRSPHRHAHAESLFWKMRRPMIQPPTDSASR